MTAVRKLIYKTNEFFSNHRSWLCYTFARTQYIGLMMFATFQQYFSHTWTIWLQMGEYERNICNENRRLIGFWKDLIFPGIRTRRDLVLRNRDRITEITSIRNCPKRLMEVFFWLACFEACRPTEQYFSSAWQKSPVTQQHKLLKLALKVAQLQRNRVFDRNNEYKSRTCCDPVNVFIIFDLICLSCVASSRVLPNFLLAVLIRTVSGARRNTSVVLWHSTKQFLIVNYMF